LKYKLKRKGEKMNTVENIERNVMNLLVILQNTTSMTQHSSRNSIDTLARNYVQTMTVIQREMSVLLNQIRDDIMDRTRRQQWFLEDAQRRQNPEIMRQVDTVIERVHTLAERVDILHAQRRQNPERMRQVETLAERIRIWEQEAIQEEREQSIKVNFKTKALKKSVAESPIDTECSICFEIPKTVDSCVTNCGHKFCKECLDNWTIHHKKSECPNCRSGLTCVNTFRLWGKGKGLVHSKKVDVIDLVA